MLTRIWFCNYPATTATYTHCHTLSLHDALPIPRADSSSRTNIDMCKPHTQAGHKRELRSRCNGTGRHGSPAGQDGIWIMLCHQALDFFFAPGNGGTCNELEACRFNHAGFDLQVGPRIICDKHFHCISVPVTGGATGGPATFRSA